jgi:hypothetical protein
MKKSKFPEGWGEQRVGAVLTHYETQTEEDAMAEDENAFMNRTRTSMEVPTRLVSKIRELIEKNKAPHTAEKAADGAC